MTRIALARPGGEGRVAAGLGQGLLIAEDHVSARAEGFAFVGSGVWVKDALGPICDRTLTWCGVL
ncbi:hypothetical protein ACFWB1_05755 [Streptomyces goshikiensis]|uniref:hypothetical protein n=1 Tax=Streptomyces goshikiensis TaxID=1942 RepID=UPI003675BCDE